MKTYGKTTWLIPDCYLEPVSNGQISHEAICVLNTSPEEAAIELTLFFEDRKTDTAFRSSCPSMRTHHIRLDRLISEDGREIREGCPTPSSSSRVSLSSCSTRDLTRRSPSSR